MRDTGSTRYFALPILIAVLRVLGSLPILLSVVLILEGALHDVRRDMEPLALGTAVLLVVIPMVVGLAVLAAAELLKVLIDIEENTRGTREALDVPSIIRKTTSEPVLDI